MAESTGNSAWQVRKSQAIARVGKPSWFVYRYIGGFPGKETAKGRSGNTRYFGSEMEARNFIATMEVK